MALCKETCQRIPTVSGCILCIFLCYAVGPQKDLTLPRCHSPLVRGLCHALELQLRLGENIPREGMQ